VTALELLCHVSRQLLPRHFRTGALELRFQLHDPGVFDQRQNGRRAGLQALTKLSQAVIPKSGVVQFGCNTTNSGSARDCESERCEQQPGERTNGAANHRAAATTHVSGFFDVQFAGLVANEHRHIVDIDQMFFLRLAQFLEGGIRAVLVLERGQDYLLGCFSHEGVSSPLCSTQAASQVLLSGTRRQV
jgi:hypothetical protein